MRGDGDRNTWEELIHCILTEAPEEINDFSDYRELLWLGRALEETPERKAARERLRKEYHLTRWERRGRKII